MHVAQRYHTTQPWSERMHGQHFRASTLAELAAVAKSWPSTAIQSPWLPFTRFRATTQRTFNQQSTRSRTKVSSMIFCVNSVVIRPSLMIQIILTNSFCKSPWSFWWRLWDGHTGSRRSWLRKWHSVFKRPRPKDGLELDWWLIDVAFITSYEIVQ